MEHRVEHSSGSLQPYIRTHIKQILYELLVAHMHNNITTHVYFHHSLAPSSPCLDRALNRFDCGTCSGINT